jgi:hypothetical protein
MQEFAIANGNLSRLMFWFSWKNDPDGKEFEKRYESWIDSLVEADKWGDTLEYTLFAYCFEIHVLCISVIYPKVVVISSYGNQPLIDASTSDFDKRPLHPNEVIFIWHHNAGNPSLFLGKDSEDAKLYNHFALIEMMQESEKVNPETSFVLTHVDKNEGKTIFENLCTPDKSQENAMGNNNKIPQEKYTLEKNKVETGNMVTDTPQKKKEKDEHNTETNQSTPTPSDSQENKVMPDPPIACRIIREDKMDLHFDRFGNSTEFHFSVLDNVGKGDCFYESILNSAVFQKHVDNALEYNIESLRDALQNFGIANPDFSMAVYKIFYDVHDVEDHSFKLLTNSLVFDDWEDTKWLFEELRTDRSVLDLIGKKRTVAAKDVAQRATNNASKW